MLRPFLVSSKKRLRIGCAEVRERTSRSLSRRGEVGRQKVQTPPSRRRVGLGRGTMAGQAGRSPPTQAATWRAWATERSASSRPGRLLPVTRAASPPIQARAVAQKTALGLVLVA